MTTTLERPFTNEVIRVARSYNWEVFHIHDQNSYENYRRVASGSGFPDLILYRTNDQGETSMLVAELKTDASYSVVRPNQANWLSAYEQFIPTFVWRPSDWDDIERILRDGPEPRRGNSSTVASSSTTPTEEGALPPHLGAMIDNLRSEIREQEFPRGDLASLRRMDIVSPSPVFWRISASRNLSGIGGTNADEKWASILQGIALLAEQDYGFATRIGRALFYGGDQARKTSFYSEQRLTQLLAARGPLLRTLMRRTFRMLVGTEHAIYWLQVARLILNDGYNEDEAETVRREIASDYYRAMAAAKRQHQTDEEDS